MENLKLKNAISEIKNSMDGPNSRLEMSKESMNLKMDP